MRKYYKTSKDNSAGKQHRKHLCRTPCSDYWSTVQSYKTWGSHHLKECKVIRVIPFFLLLLCPVNYILINIWQTLSAFLTRMHNKHLHQCIALSICWMCKSSTSARGWFLVSLFLQSVKVTLNANMTLWHASHSSQFGIHSIPSSRSLMWMLNRLAPSIHSWGTALVISLQLDVPIDHKPLGPAM